MSNTIYLYLKTHNVTGLKYLGKTEASDPHQYSGSGMYWLRHLEKHGKDVRTEILFETSDKELFKEVALEYSHRLNVVESNEYANLVHECGDGGCNNLGRTLSDEWKKNIGNSVSQTKNSKEWKETVGKSAREKDSLIKNDPEWRENVGKPSWEAGAKKQSETKLDPEWISKHQLICEHYNKSVDTANYERWHGDNCSVVKPRISTPIKNYITCPHCFKEGKDGSAMRRWHFNNCKKVK